MVLFGLREGQTILQRCLYSPFASAPQHAFYFLPLPQGQGSFLPTRRVAFWGGRGVGLGFAVLVVYLKRVAVRESNP